MIIHLLAMAVRMAITSLISQALQKEVMSYLKRIYAVVQALLAKYPTLIPALAVIASGFLAKDGWHVSTTTLLYVASVVAALIGRLVHNSVKAAARKPAGK